MSQYSIPGRGKGAAQVVSHATKTVSNSAELLSPAMSKPTCVEIFVSCTGAGDVALTDWGGNTAVYTLTVGNHWIQGMWKLIKSTGTTATATYVARFATP